MKVSPGNVISAEIKFQSGKLYYSLTNHNSSKTWNHVFASSYSKYADRQTVEWFSTWYVSSTALSPYGTAEFGPKYTLLGHSGEATISGTTKVTGSHSGLVKIIEYLGSILLASTGVLAEDKQSFVLTWKHL